LRKTLFNGKEINAELSTMLLNKIWIGFFFVAIITGLVKLIGFGDVHVFKNMADSLFNSSSAAFNLALGLTGALCVWMGFMRVGEKGGAVNLLSKAIRPLFRRLFPSVPDNHPAVGSIMMNFSANMLGLDNAATPLGLKAMRELQELNEDKETASNAQIMFLVLNTSGLTIIPVTVLATLSVEKSSNPTEVFIPILLATFCSTLVGLLAVAIRQRIKIIDPVILLYLGGMTAFLVSLLVGLSYYPQYTSAVTNVGGNLLLLGIVMIFFVLAIRKKVNVYEEFIEGAKDGFQVAIGIVPYLVAMLIAIGIFRASGALDEIIRGIKFFFIFIGIHHIEFVDALPVAIMKPLSGGGARGMMLEIIHQFGANDFRAKVAATLQGSTETTFYVLAVYFGSVGIKKTRYALQMGLLADLVGIIAAILLSYYFYEISA
jgi:spore maturation protein SpmA